MTGQAGGRVEVADSTGRRQRGQRVEGCEFVKGNG